ncbi:MAG TPA: glutamate-5-semialdehyde dehydrogenase, partial [Gaiellales bacterium]
MAIATPDVSARARAAARELAPLGRARKDAALESIARRIESATAAICEANEADVAEAVAAGTGPALVDRLTLDAPRVAALAAAVRAVAALGDPVGETVTGWRLPNGLDVQKVRIPLGVLLVVYEARPNVTADVAALAIKSGNACVLRGSSSARRTNGVLIDAVRAGLEDAGLPADAVVDFACSRDELAAFVGDPRSCDVVIPRGGEQLKHFLIEHSRVPVLAAAGGNCHVYLHADADPQAALEIIVNAKTQRPGVCNAAETLLVHRDALALLAPIGVALRDAGVELRADPDAAEALGVPSLPASDEDWATEYLDLVLAIRTVG